MMISGQRNVPEDYQATEDVLDAMTVWLSRRAVSNLRTASKSNGTTELLQAVTVTEDVWIEAKETAETKGELSRERA